MSLVYPTSSTHRGRIGHQIAHTLTTSGNQGVAVPSQDKEHQSQLTIRRLTPRECFRLQGFPDWAYDKAALSDKELEEIACRKQEKGETDNG